MPPTITAAISTTALLCAILAAGGCGCSGQSTSTAPPTAPPAAPQAAQPATPPVDERQQLRDEMMTIRLENAVKAVCRQAGWIDNAVERITWTKTVNDERHGIVTFIPGLKEPPKEIVLMMGGHNFFYFTDRPANHFVFNTED
jgi:glucose/arabinose dehydrogenase